MTHQINHTIQLPIIGFHHSPLIQKFGVPRQPNLVEVCTHIEMLPPYNTLDAFVGINEFSHLWILWQFHHNRPQSHFKPQVRPPRLGGNEKVGVFASRSMYRPSSTGLSVVEFLNVEIENKTVKLHLKGADFIDGTPILDIKPYIAYSDAIPSANSGYAQSVPSIKKVEFLNDAIDKFNKLIFDKFLLESDMVIIKQLIAQDPRPAFKQNDMSEYKMQFKQVDITFKMTDANKFLIVDVSPLHSSFITNG